jgi:hypothetical protein
MFVLSCSRTAPSVSTGNGIRAGNRHRDNRRAVVLERGSPAIRQDPLSVMAYWGRNRLAEFLGSKIGRQPTPQASRGINHRP